MNLIKSISGIRGIVGEVQGEGFTPWDIISSTVAFGQWLKKKYNTHIYCIIGRDGRASGSIISKTVGSTLQSMGIHTVDIGCNTTPSLANYIPKIGAQGGIMITASHNPIEWNGLKLFNALGESLSRVQAEEVYQEERYSLQARFEPHNQLGKYIRHQSEKVIQYHINKIKALSLVQVEAIKKHNFSIAIDTINSSGSIAIPLLLYSLGVKNIQHINNTCDGQFAHNPEPLIPHLGSLINIMQTGKYDIGFVVDPDVDRLVMITENGYPFGEEYTLVAIADYILQHSPYGCCTVSNISSTKSLQKLSNQYKSKHFSSPIGESHVIEKMKERGAIIGGEGNGGIIYPKLHYSRDALVGIALILSYLATSKKKISAIKQALPQYYMIKLAIEITATQSVEKIFEKLQSKYQQYPIEKTDGIKIFFEDAWINIRKSNTESKLRIIVEAPTEAEAKAILSSVKEKIGIII